MTRTTRSIWLAASVLLVLCGTLKTRATPATATPPITACVFTSDGSSLLAARSNAILVLSVRDASLQRTLTPDDQRVTGLAFGRNGELLAVAGGVPGESGRVLLVDWKSGRVIARAGEFRDLTTCVAFSPDGRALAAASADGTVRLFAVSSAADRLEPLARLEGHAGPVLAVVFDNAGKTVVTASADRSIKVWNAADGTLTRTLSNHTGPVHCLAPRPTPDKPATPAAAFACASGGDDHTVRVWQPGVGRMVRIVRRHEGPVFSVCYAPGGAALFSAGAEGIVRIINADSDTIEQQWTASDDWIYALSASPDGKHVATGDAAGSVKLWTVDAEEVHLHASYPPANAD